MDIGDQERIKHLHPKSLTMVILLALALFCACGLREQSALSPATAPQNATTVGPLPDSALHIKWSPVDMPKQLTAGAMTPVTVTFANGGDTIWPDKIMANPQLPDGSRAVRLGYSWGVAGQPPEKRQFGPGRTDLSKPLGPGESATLQIDVLAPNEPGDYVLSFELVQELVAWLTDRGAETLTVPIRVVSAGG